MDSILKIRNVDLSDKFGSGAKAKSDARKDSSTKNKNKASILVNGLVPQSIYQKYHQPDRKSSKFTVNLPSGSLEISPNNSSN